MKKENASTRGPVWCCLAEVESSWNVMAHGDARVGKWRGNWQMEWVAVTHTLHRNMVYPALLPLMCTRRLPVVDWTDAPANLNGLVRFGNRWNVVSARVPLHFKRSLADWMLCGVPEMANQIECRKHLSFFIIKPYYCRAARWGSVGLGSIFLVIANIVPKFDGSKLIEQNTFHVNYTLYKAS
jgi:hypothetical protein